ncbi:hypothetical protein HMPREF1411_01604 [Helicobacter pylori GAM250AFi]|nr:hypothetical protein HMPREF1411_01604 [Helicobacter pylori GAM250AFi]EMH54139.1 hypothetical protein HMPREF1441_00334 [Helicobacter pylori HP250ASi]EMH54582.1 hypothetical protein HMPREF1443_01640 [Helicobacter pylori HP250BFi]EMH57796.1 hypothetical protein HMPREF1445_00767 [Helicobacter pylori HP250BFiii]EMH59515.1 hypothetical protein HMPREF1446_01625 [Helicobacter pylori HP250BFiV]
MECFLWYPLVFVFNNKIFFIITHFHAPNFTFKIKPFKISNFNRL